MGPRLSPRVQNRPAAAAAEANLQEVEVEDVPLEVAAEDGQMEME